MSLKAQINFNRENFQKAEKWYALLIKQYPDSTELVEKSKTMLASASFKSAEEYKNSGDAFKAAIKFERTAYNTKDTKIAEAAMFEAANQYEKSGKPRRGAAKYDSRTR